MFGKSNIGFSFIEKWRDYFKFCSVIILGVRDLERLEREVGFEPSFEE